MDVKKRILEIINVMVDKDTNPIELLDYIHELLCYIMVDSVKEELIILKERIIKDYNLSMLICPKCNIEYDPYWNFCQKCGVKLIENILIN